MDKKSVFIVVSEGSTVEIEDSYTNADVFVENDGTGTVTVKNTVHAPNPHTSQSPQPNAAYTTYPTP